GELWMEENGDDSFDKISRIDAGANNGWIQSMGPLERVREYKGIETSPRFFGLQQVRWSPVNIADTPEDALNRMVMIPGSFYNSPEFSFRYAVPPAGLGFLTSNALGAQYKDNLFMGSAVTGTNPVNALAGGYLMRFQFNDDRSGFDFGADPNIVDKGLANLDKHESNQQHTALLLFR